MPPRVLVVYDTKNGPTAEIAQAIDSRLGQHGALVKTQLARDARDLAGFDAVVLGAPIYSGRWLSGAHRLLKRAAKLAPDSRPRHPGLRSRGQLGGWDCTDARSVVTAQSGFRRGR